MMNNSVSKVLVAGQSIRELTWHAIIMLELVEGEDVRRRVVCLLRRICEGLAGQGAFGLIGVRADES